MLTAAPAQHSMGTGLSWTHSYGLLLSHTRLYWSVPVRWRSMGGSEQTQHVRRSQMNGIWRLALSVPPLPVNAYMLRPPQMVCA